MLMRLVRLLLVRTWFRLRLLMCMIGNDRLGCAVMIRDVVLRLMLLVMCRLSLVIFCTLGRLVRYLRLVRWMGLA